MPRFLTAGAGSIWTLNQGDGTVTRIDTLTRRVTATIAVGIPGHGGDIAWGGGSIWATLLGVPLTAIEPKTNKVVRQWIGPGGDSLRFGHDSIWLTDLKQGTLARIAYRETLKFQPSR
jgi:YVTN family beta-propeller protein